MAASQAVQHSTPGRSLNTSREKTKGWISRATYDSLPEIFQASARDLVKKGRIEIENMPCQAAGAREHGIRETSL